MFVSKECNKAVTYACILYAELPHKIELIQLFVCCLLFLSKLYKKKMLKLRLKGSACLYIWMVD